MRGKNFVVSMGFLVFFLFLVTACSDKGYVSKSVEFTPIIEMVDLFDEQEYNVTDSRVVGKNCIETHYSELNDSKFVIKLGEKEWLAQPPVVGETNYLRRVVTIHNLRDELDTAYLDKIYIYDGKETRRSKTPLKFLVEAKSNRDLFVLWDTQYDPKKDVIVDFTNNTEAIGVITNIAETCVDKLEYYNTTKTKDVKVGAQEEVVGQKRVVRVNLN